MRLQLVLGGVREDGGVVEPNGWRPEVVEVVAEVVAPVVRGMTRPGEVDAVLVGWVDRELRLELTLRGETFHGPLWAPGEPPWSAPAARHRLASDLQDFIAESTFAWGELRTPGAG